MDLSPVIRPRLPEWKTYFIALLIQPTAMYSLCALRVYSFSASVGTLLFPSSGIWSVVGSLFVLLAETTQAQSSPGEVWGPQKGEWSRHQCQIKKKGNSGGVYFLVGFNEDVSCTWFQILEHIQYRNLTQVLPFMRWYHEIITECHGPFVTCKPSYFRWDTGRERWFLE